MRIAHPPAIEKAKVERRVTAIVVTDILCWVPFIVVSALHNGQLIDACLTLPYHAHMARRQTLPDPPFEANPHELKSWEGARGVQIDASSWYASTFVRYDIVLPVNSVVNPLIYIIFAWVPQALLLRNKADRRET